MPDQNTERKENDDDCCKAIHRPCYCAGRKECHDCGTPLNEDEPECKYCSNDSTDTFMGELVCKVHLYARELAEGV